MGHGRVCARDPGRRSANVVIDARDKFRAHRLGAKRPSATPEGSHAARPNHDVHAVSPRPVVFAPRGIPLSPTHGIPLLHWRPYVSKDSSTNLIVYLFAVVRAPLNDGDDAAYLAPYRACGWSSGFFIERHRPFPCRVSFRMDDPYGMLYEALDPLDTGEGKPLFGCAVEDLPSSFVFFRRDPLLLRKW